MDNQLQVSSTLQSPIVLNHKEIEIAKIIYHVNQLTAYPLSSIQIEDWSKSLNELLPELDLLKLKNLINDMKRGIVEWNTKKGIQNLFVNLTDTATNDFLSQL